MRKMMQMRAFVNRPYKEERRKQKACGREGHAPALWGADPPGKRESPEGANGRVARVRRWGARSRRRTASRREGRPPPGRANAPGKRRRAPQGPQRSKRPARARRPGLPRAGPAVLSAMAGLTAGFGMGPGDPRLRGRARAGRSPRGPGSGRPGVLRPACARLDSSGAIFNRDLDVSEELGLLVPLA